MRESSGMPPGQTTLSLLLLEHVIKESRSGKSLLLSNLHLREMLQATSNDRGKIDELLEYIKSRIKELEEEVAELQGWKQKDDERKCLEYAHYFQQKTAFATALEEIDQARQGGTDATGANEKEFQEGARIVSGLEAQLQKLGSSLEFLRIERQQLEDQRKDIARAKAKAELQVKNMLGLHRGLIGQKREEARVMVILGQRNITLGRSGTVQSCGNCPKDGDHLRLKIRLEAGVNLAVEVDS